MCLNIALNYITNLIYRYGLVFATSTVYNATDKYSASLSVCVCVWVCHACVCAYTCVCEQTMHAEANCHITYKSWHFTFHSSTLIILRYAKSRSCIEMQHWTLKPSLMDNNKFTALAHLQHLNWCHTPVEQNSSLIYYTLLEKNKISAKLYGC